jgi:hypothetical protein
LAWRNWFDEHGRIAHAWKVKMFPTLLVIDHKGVIRRHYEGNPGPELDAVLEQLVREAEKDRKTS